MNFLEKKLTYSLLAFFLSVLVVVQICFLNGVYAVSNPDLQEQIDEKNMELQKINVQIQQTQSYITSLQGQSKTLSSALKELDYEIDQVNFGIRSSEISIEKLTLELESLGIKLDDIGKEIDIKDDAIAQILRQVQQKDRDGMLEVLLTTGTLADSVLEFQGLRDLEDNLTISVTQLTELQGLLKNTVEVTNLKKGELEDEHVSLKSREEILSDQQAEKDALLKETQNQENIYEQKLAELEAIRVEVADEIDKIEEELRKKVNPSSLPTARKGVLEVPVIGTLTQGYGNTSFARYTYKSQWHNGIDIGAPVGTPIIAAEDGTVVFTANQDAVLTNGKAYCRGGAYGKVIVIKHTNNLATLYGHMSLILVSNGDTVERGDLIGYVGKTGWSTGPHIHFSVFDAATFILNQSRVCGPMPVGGDLNPLSYLSI
jgi:murein DD-endopeptidase MepM/ murein hydrolase activator NlpD